MVHATARMFAAQVRREEEDLEQELRVRVWRAIVTYDPSKSRLTLERYVFQAVTNKVKDFKRDAARENRRREENGLTFLHIEDMRSPLGQDCPRRTTVQEVFDGYFNHATHDEVYGRIDEGLFVLPATVTDDEASVLLLLMMDMNRAEIAMRLAIARECVDASVVALRRKFADWKPSDPSQAVGLATVVAA